MSPTLVTWHEEVEPGISLYAARRHGPAHSVPRLQRGDGQMCWAAGCLSYSVPRGVPAISCHQVDASRYWRTPGRVAKHGSSVVPACHAGVVSATTGRLQHSGECTAGRPRSRPASNSPTLHYRNTDRRTNHAPHVAHAAHGGSRASRPGRTPCCVQRNLQAAVPMLDAAGTPNCCPTCHQCFLVSAPADRHSADVVAMLPGTQHNPSPESNCTITWPAHNT
jgi:hypothetical protein